MDGYVNATRNALDTAISQMLSDPALTPLLAKSADRVFAATDLLRDLLEQQQSASLDPRPMGTVIPFPGNGGGRAA